MSKVLWFNTYERACENFAEDGDEDAFRAELEGLGFDDDEITCEIAAAKDEL